MMKAMLCLVFAFVAISSCCLKSCLAEDVEFQSTNFLVEDYKAPLQPAPLSFQINDIDWTFEESDELLNLSEECERYIFSLAFTTNDIDWAFETSRDYLMSASEQVYTFGGLRFNR